jgi:hypothetical protein
MEFGRAEPHGLISVVLNLVYCIVHDRERISVSKNGNNEQHTEDQERTAYSVVHTTVSPPRSQDDSHNGVKSTSFQMCCCLWK